jgi:hypothetical protein
MKRQKYRTFKLLCFSFIFLTSLFSNNILYVAQSDIQLSKNLSCTNFAASFGDTVLFGNSEDGGLQHPLGMDPLSSRMFYYGADAEGYACAFVGWYWEGYAVSIQGGMNEKGLCYDQTGIPDTPVNTPPNPTYTVAGSWIMKDVLRLNANVSEVIDFFMSCDWSGYWWFQWLFADAFGDVVIISPGIDGDLVFTRKNAGEDGFLTQTNFNRANNKSGSYPCWRYEASYELLSEIEGEEDLTPIKFNEVLDAVHFPKSGGSFTHYSNTFDPVNKILYLNYMGNFDETATVNVTEELDGTEFKAVPIADYFSEETAENGFKNYKKWKGTTIFVYRVLPITAIALILGGISVGVYFLIKKLLKRRKNL